MSVSSLHQIKWAAADSNFFFFSGYIPQGALLGTVSEIMSLMITTLILLQTHLNAAYPGSLINTLQGRPLCPFFLSEAPWWNRPITVVISAPMLQMTGPHYLQQPWKLRSYWFSEIQFYFLACGWFLVAAEGEEKSLEVCVCVWLTAVNHMSVRWESSFREASHRWKARRRRHSIPPLSLFLIHCFSLSPCLVRAPTDFLFSVPSPQTHENNSCYRAEPWFQTLPSWESDVLLPFCLPFSRSTSLLSFQCHQFICFYPRQRKWISCRVQYTV